MNEELQFVLLSWLVLILAIIAITGILMFAISCVENWIAARREKKTIEKIRKRNS